MGEGQNYSAMAVMTWGAWSLVAVLLVGLWAALLVGEDPMAQAFGFTACATSAVAATLHIRRFICRGMQLVRRLHNEDDLREREVFEMGRDSVTELHPLR